MTESRAQVTSAQARERDLPPGAHDARELLLAGLPVAERQLDLAGVSTVVLEGGEGPPVVLLHGPGEYGAKWARLFPLLVATHRVLAPDLPGHGASEAPGPLPADQVLEWLGELIERTCQAPPVLVGQILGGAIAARFASGHGGLLSRLVLVDTLGLTPFRPAPEFGLAFNDFLAEPTEETHDRLWRRCAFDLDRMRGRMGETWELIKAYNLDRARAPSLKATQHSLMEGFGLHAISEAELARIEVPTTLIWGRHDLATPLEVAEEAGARYGWLLRVIEDAADDPAMEQPEAFAKALHAAITGS